MPRDRLVRARRTCWPSFERRYGNSEADTTLSASWPSQHPMILFCLNSSRFVSSSVAPSDPHVFFYFLFFGRIRKGVQAGRKLRTPLSSPVTSSGDGFAHVKQAFEGHTLHLIGLLSNGGVYGGTSSSRLFQGAMAARRDQAPHLAWQGRPDGSSIEFVGSQERP